MAQSLPCEYCLRPLPAGGASCKCGYNGKLNNPWPSLPEGTWITNRYRLAKIEGQGGFGICYRAWDAQALEKVAIKELFPNGMAQRVQDSHISIARDHVDDFHRAVRMMEREAQILRHLNSEPFIVKVRDFFRANNTFYLVMNFEYGASYERLLSKKYAPGGPFRDTRAAVGDALILLGQMQTVHEKELLHLDIKPANIRILKETRQLVLLDFGAAREAFRSGNEAGGNLYTPGFAAYEQHYGEGVTSPASDVHGIAATLYYSLSMQRPPSAWERAKRGVAIPPLPELNPSVPWELGGMIHKALSVEPAHRFATAAEFRDAIKEFGPSRVSGVAFARSDLQVEPTEAEESIPAPTGRRLQAGGIDIIAALCLVAAIGGTATGIEAVSNAAVTTICIWWVLQLFPGIGLPTPGMWLRGLRLESAGGKRPGFAALFKRTTLMLVCSIFLPLTADSAGLWLNDRAGGTSVSLR